MTITHKRLIADDGKACVIKCPTCGAISRLNYSDKAQYLEDLKRPCKRCK